MSRIILLIAVVFLSGCTQDRPLTNDEIISEVAKCEAAGMGVEVHRDFWGAYEPRH